MTQTTEQERELKDIEQALRLVREAHQHEVDTYRQELYKPEGDRKPKDQLHRLGDLICLLQNILYAAQQASRRAQVVPQGWKLIPTEPTLTMQQAALKHVARQHQTRDIYAAMLAAAPQPPEAASTPSAYRADVHKGECIDERCPGCCEPAAAPDLDKLTTDVLTKLAEAAPVQMPESISKVLEDCHSRAIDYATCPSPYNNIRLETAFQYLEHQVRQLLATPHGLEQDAARWREALRHIGADNMLGGAQFVIRGLPAPVNVMRGSVAEHFTKAIDAALAAQAKQGATNE